MRIFFFRAWQWSWGILQTLVGAIFFWHYRRAPHERYRGTVVTYWDRRGDNLSLGMFVFLDGEKRSSEKTRALLAHEYGHCVQSLLLGPLYPLVIGIPSLIWAVAFAAYRKKNSISYDAFFPEKWATRIGEKRRKTDA